MISLKPVPGVLLFIVVFYISGCSQKMVSLPEIEEPIVLYDKKEEISEGSLWPGETSRNMLFIDSKAKKVGDIVTVFISENSSATKKATTDTTKDNSVAVSTGGIFGLPGNLGITNLFGLGNSFDPNMDATNKNQFKGQGSTTREDNFTATIAATIIKVLNNGNLVIEGKRKVSLNYEDQNLTLTGIIRPEDIAFDNTISSKLIANAEITYSGNGVLSDKQRAGWGVRLIDLVWPF